MTSSSVSCHKFDVLLTFSIVFPNTELFIVWESSSQYSFWFLFLVPCSYLWMISTMLLIDWIRLLCLLFPVLVHVLMSALRFFCVHCIFLSWLDYTQGFWHLSVSILLAKNDRLCSLCNSLGYLTLTSSVYPLSLSSLS